MTTPDATKAPQDRGLIAASPTTNWVQTAESLARDLLEAAAEPRSLDLGRYGLLRMRIERIQEKLQLLRRHAPGTCRRCEEAIVTFRAMNLNLLAREVDNAASPMKPAVAAGRRSCRPGKRIRKATTWRRQARPRPFLIFIGKFRQ